MTSKEKLIQNDSRDTGSEGQLCLEKVPAEERSRDDVLKRMLSTPPEPRKNTGNPQKSKEKAK